MATSYSDDSRIDAATAIYDQLDVEAYESELKKRESRFEKICKEAKAEPVKAKSAVCDDDDHPIICYRALATKPMQHTHDTYDARVHFAAEQTAQKHLDTPLTYAEACDPSRSDAPQWHKASTDEIRSHIKNDSFCLVPRPKLNQGTNHPECSSLNVRQG